MALGGRNGILIFISQSRESVRSCMRKGADSVSLGLCSAASWFRTSSTGWSCHGGSTRYPSPAMFERAGWWVGIDKQSIAPEYKIPDGSSETLAWWKVSHCGLAACQWKKSHLLTRIRTWQTAHKRNQIPPYGTQNPFKKKKKPLQSD